MKSTAERTTKIVANMKSRGWFTGASQSQLGLSLVELVIALAIISLIAGVTVVAIDQLLQSSRQANDQQQAVSQLRQAEHWMTRDALMSQTVVPDAVNPSGFPVTLSWTTSQGVAHEVTYSLEDMSGSSHKRLRRQVIIDGGSPSTLWLAEGIEVGEGDGGEQLTSCSYLRPVLTVTLTVTSGTHTETRVFQAKLRSDIAT